MARWEWAKRYRIRRELGKTGSEVTQVVLDHKYENGLTLVAEPMPWLESIAVIMLIPSGCERDPADRLGLSNFVCEMIQRGCGSRDSRAFVEAFEYLGVDFAASVSTNGASIGATMPAESLVPALQIFGDVVQDPHLPEDQLEDGRRVCLQEVFALQDDLRRQVMLELKRRRYPDPDGRNPTGDLQAIESIQIDEVRKFYEDHYHPNETILAVAGKFDWESLRDEVGAIFGTWKRHEVSAVPTHDRIGGTHHIPFESSQTHIGLSYDSAPYASDDFFLARGVVGVLSDGMSSRLFTEIREKRGLCYSVYASCNSTRTLGSVVCYAGTSTERAQETLNVLVDELMRVREGITDEELDRLKVQIRSNLIMQQESSLSRASSIASDWYFLSRARTLDEVNEIIQGLTTARINRYVQEHPPQNFTLVTLGAQALEEPIAISASLSGQRS